MSEIPMNAKILIDEFWAQQKAEMQKRAREKQQQALQRGWVDSTPKKPLTAKELQRYARTFGFSVDDGGGRHGVHLVAPNGQECPLPVHGGGRNLANGTQRSIVNFIQQNGVYRG